MALDVDKWPAPGLGRFSP